MTEEQKPEEVQEVEAVAAEPEVEVMTPLQAEEENKKDDKKLQEEEVAAAFNEELGEDWLSYQPKHVRIFVQFLRVLGAQLSLYFFLISLALMGDGLTALTGKTAGGLFGGSLNPLIALMIGVLATVLVQSSSTTTSIIVVLVSNEIVDVETAIPMIMGANIGTSVTNTIVSLGFVEDTAAYQRGFAGATVHDMFNFLNVLILLPAEVIVSALNGGNGGLLQIVAEAIAGGRGEKELSGGDEFSDANPIKKITNPILDKMVDINKDVISDYAQGFPGVPDNTDDCDVVFQFNDEETGVDALGCVDFFCDFCPDGVFNQTLYTLAEDAFDNEELISGGYFQQYGDNGGGIAVLIIALVMMIISLASIVRFLTAIVRGSAQKILMKTLNYNFVGGGYLAIVVGVALTFVVQSSSITTSILTPLVAIGALDLENMFPFTLGANIGTTGTGLIAAAAEGTELGYTIAMVHFFFNIFGVLIWFPAPFMRNVPLTAARNLGSMAAIWKMIPILYLFMAFFFYPLVLFAFAEGFEVGGAGGKVGASLGIVVFVVFHVYAFFWYHKKDGRNKFLAFVEKRKAAVEAKKAARIAAAEDTI